MNTIHTNPDPLMAEGRIHFAVPRLFHLLALAPSLIDYEEEIAPTTTATNGAATATGDAAAAADGDSNKKASIIIII